jgi:MoxR-like ATPase
LLQGEPVKANVEIDPALAISKQEWHEWQGHLSRVKLSPETLQAIHLIKGEMHELHEKSPQGMEFYISDRRWQKAVLLLKSSAFFSGREVTSHLDTLLLRHCLWSSGDEKISEGKCTRGTVEAIVTRHLGSSMTPDIDFAEIDLLLEQAENFV